LLRKIVVAASVVPPRLPARVGEGAGSGVTDGLLSVIVGGAVRPPRAAAAAEGSRVWVTESRVTVGVAVGSESVTVIVTVAPEPESLLSSSVLLPVMPPSTPMSVTSPFAMVCKVHTKKVPFRRTDGRAKQFVGGGHSFSRVHEVPSHCAMEPSIQAESPLLQGSDAFNVWNWTFRVWASFALLMRSLWLRAGVGRAVERRARERRERRTEWEKERISM